VYLAQWGYDMMAMMFGTLDNGVLNYPMGVAVDDAGNVYVTDTGFDDFTAGFNRIQKFDSNGMFLLKWGSQGTGEGQFSTPHGIAVDGDGFVYVADGDNNRVQKFTSEGVFVTQWGSQGTGAGQFNAPYGIAVKGNEAVYVVEHYNHRVQQFTCDGTPVFMWGSNGTGQGQFNYPYGAAVDGSGRVYVADSENHRIQVFGFVEEEPPPILDVVDTLIVEINIRPGTPNNMIVLNNPKMIVTVALLTTPEFDAMTADPSTVLFEGATEREFGKWKKHNPHRPARSGIDVDRDGDKDMLFFFNVGDTQLTKESTEGTLTGSTVDGKAFKGTDKVRCVGWGHRRS